MPGSGPGYDDGWQDRKPKLPPPQTEQELIDSTAVITKPGFPQEAADVLWRIKRLCAEFNYDAKGQFTFHDLVITWQYLKESRTLLAGVQPRNPPEIVRHRRVSLPGQHIIIYHLRDPSVLHAAINGTNVTICGAFTNNTHWRIEEGFQQVTCKACMNSIVGPT